MDGAVIFTHLYQSWMLKAAMPSIQLAKPFQFYSTHTHTHTRTQTHSLLDRNSVHFVSQIFELLAPSIYENVK